MMKTFVVIFFSFAVFELVNSFPRDGTNPANSILTNDLGITDNLADILQEPNDGLREITIPSFDELTTNSDPLQLAQEIKKIADPNKRKELVSQLKQAWNDHKDTLPGKFYQAAYASLINPAEAAKFWTKELEKETQNVVKSGISIVERANNGVTGVFGNIQKIAQIDPLGIALLRGDSVLLTILSDGSKNMGMVSDLVYDTAGNVVGVHRMVTAPLNGIPVAGDIMGNIDGLIDAGLSRGKYLSGSFAKTGTSAFATLARDSAKRADGKESKLRQVIGGPTLQTLE